MKGPSAPRPEFEPSSVCLAKMVQNFIDESNEKQPSPKCGRSRCNCFHGNSNDSSDDELDIFGGDFGDSISSGSFGGDASDILKSLIPCVTVSERNLRADTARIVEANKNLKQKDDLRKMVTDGLESLGYDSFTCKSKWEKSSSFPVEKKTKDKQKSKHHKGDRLSKIWELRERQRIVSMDTYQNLNQWSPPHISQVQIP